MTREIIGNVLTHSGYKVCKAENGMKAIDQLSHEKPDLILLDILLPDINGLELLNLMRLQYFTDGNIPIILISQLDKPEVTSTAMRLGANDMITKPFDPAILIAKLSKLDIN